MNMQMGEPAAAARTSTTLSPEARVDRFLCCDVRLLWLLHVRMHTCSILHPPRGPEDIVNQS